MEWTESKVLEVIRECREEGSLYAQKQLAKLRGEGPKWAVVNEATDKVVNTMLDVCGFAHLSIKARGKFYQLAKKISQREHWYRFNCGHDSYNGGGRLSIYDMSMRQEMSVNVASYRGVQEILKKYGIESTLHSRID